MYLKNFLNLSTECEDAVLEVVPKSDLCLHDQLRHGTIVSSTIQFILNPWTYKKKLVICMEALSTPVKEQ